MDVLYFLNKRTEFIKNFYEDASFQFTDRKNKIDAGEFPFDPPYSENGEPAFLDEWIEANEALDVLQNRA
jgi:hypothetical protein